MKEIWKDIEGFEGYYQISNIGRVKSLSRFSCQKHFVEEKILKQRPNNSGYMDVILYKDGKKYHKKVHRLVAKAFVENPKNLNEVDHIDTNKKNNNFNNLRWVTHSENHLNPLTVELKKMKLTGKKLSKERVDKMRHKIQVSKEGVILHTFDSYKDLDENSKGIIGTQLWNIYARDVIKGKRKQYKGYTFKRV
jgi:hypothetical protein